MGIDRIRVMVADDASAAARWLRRHEPALRPLDGSLRTTLSTLIDDRRLLAGCVESRSPHSDWSFEAMLLSGFPTMTQSARIFADPSPRLCRELLSQCAAGRAAEIFMSRKEVAEHAPQRELDLVVLGIWQSTYDFTTAPGRRLLALSCDLLERLHRGYRIGRVLVSTDQRLEPSLRAAGLSRLRREPDGFAEHPRVVGSLGRKEAAQRWPGAPLARLFEWQAPEFRLTPDQQDVVELALQHLSDAEIAQRLGVDTKAVQTRWQRIYQKVVHVLPDFFDEQGQGPGSRRRALAYLAEHPEEVRPYRVCSCGLGRRRCAR